MSSPASDLKQSRPASMTKGIAGQHEKALALYREGLLPSALRVLKTTLEEAGSTASRRDLLELKAAHGRLLFLSGKTALGFSFLSEALKISIEDRDSKAMARILVELGEVYEAWGNPMLALEYLSQALWTLQDLQEHERLVRCLFGLARIHFRMAYHEECSAFLRQMREASHNSKNRLLIGTAELMEAELLVKLGISRKLPDQCWLDVTEGPRGPREACRARSLKCLAMTELFAGRPASAADYLREMLKCLRRLKLRHDEAEGLLLLSRASFEIGDKLKAGWLLSEALKLTKRIENRGLEAEALLQTADGKADERALTLLRKGLELAKQVNDNELMMRYNHKLAATQSVLGRSEDAVDSCLEFRKLFQKVASLSANLQGRIEQRIDVRKILLEVSFMSDPLLS